MQLSWLERYNLLIFDEIDSTNSEALRLAKAGTPGDFVIWARQQSAGRGRYGKFWHSQEGNLYVTLLLNRNIITDKQPQLSFVTALAAYETVSALGAENNLAVKWPNDIMLNNKKLAGILLEAVNLYGRNSLIIGLGINLKNHPEILNTRATNLKAEGISAEDPSRVLNLFINFFEKYYNIWQQWGFAAIRRNWLQKAYNIDKVITFNDGSGKISGKFKGIDASGAIKIELACGHIYSLSAGEVFFGQASD